MQNTTIHLIARHFDGSSSSVQIEPNQGVFVGKSSNCGLRLEDDDISDIHCRIGFEEGELWIQDWMSSQGTSVDGEVLEAKTKLTEASVVGVGPFSIEIQMGISPAQQDIHEEEADSADDEEGNFCRISQFNHMRGDTDSDVLDTGNENVTAAAHEETSVDEFFEASCDALGDVDEDRQDLSTDESEDLWIEEQIEELVQSPVAVTEQISTEPENPPGNELDQKDDSNFDDSSVEPGFRKDADLDLDFGFDSQDEEVFDRETVSLLQAEIEDLRSILAQRDADCGPSVSPVLAETSIAEESEKTLGRIQELSDEANRAEERVLLLEEMLQAADDVNRAEVEERSHLEAWVGDIERRLGQKEDEHRAEIEALKTQLAAAEGRSRHLQQQLKQAAAPNGKAEEKFDEELDSLQEENLQLQASLQDAKRELQQLQHRVENQSEQSEALLREERAKIAKEQAEVSRLKFEYAQKLEDLSKSIPQAELDPRLQILREHRQEIRENSQSKNLEPAESSLSSRLKKLWSLVE